MDIHDEIKQLRGSMSANRRDKEMHQAEVDHHSRCVRELTQDFAAMNSRLKTLEIRVPLEERVTA